MKVTISNSYNLKWQIKDAPNYKFTSDGICINTKRGKVVKRIINGGSVGYCINGKFKSLFLLRKELVKIKTIDCPF